MSRKIDVPDSPKDLPLAVVKQMITLSTSGFGLVSALAWNEFVKSIIDGFIKPYLPEGSKMITLFIYAAIVTTLAVVVTLQLALMEKRLEKIVKSEEKGKSNK